MVAVELPVIILPRIAVVAARLGDDGAVFVLDDDSEALHCGSL
jgi:hypothetical protein